MADIVLFGATGFTGCLTAEALARRGASFAIAGRNRAKLEDLAAKTGSPDVRVAAVGDVDALVRALDDAQVLVTCVGPFVELGGTAVQAALRAGVHYVDSTGEAAFIEWLIEEHSDAARERGIAMAPALGFDEVPADVAVALATAGMEGPDVVLTYAFPSAPSTGTLRTSLGIVSNDATWIEDGAPRKVPVASEQRWAPMPPPLGPRLSVAFGFSEGHLAPLHTDVRSLKLFATVGTPQRHALKVALPALRWVRSVSAFNGILEKVLERRSEGPDEATRLRDRWTILAEARDEKTWRNVALQGRDAYGLTAELLAVGALAMTAPGYDRRGVVSPVQAVGLEDLQKALLDLGVTFETYAPVSEGD